MESEIISDECGGLFLKGISTTTDFSLEGIKFSPKAAALFETCLVELSRAGTKKIWVSNFVLEKN